MTLSEQIIAAIRARNAAGETYECMAGITGVSRAYIHQIANNRSDPLKLSLEKFFALFPSAQIYLDGAASAAPVSGDSLRHERELLELERAELAAQRRELEEARKNIELEKEIFELKKNAAALPPVLHHTEPAAPYVSSVTTFRVVTKYDLIPSHTQNTHPHPSLRIPSSRRGDVWQITQAHFIPPRPYSFESHWGCHFLCHFTRKRTKQDASVCIRCLANMSGRHKKATERRGVDARRQCSGRRKEEENTGQGGPWIRIAAGGTSFRWI